MGMATETHARLFWSGGSQAVRLPKAMRLPGKQVIVRRRGATVILEPLPDEDNWDGFWPIRHGKTRAAERRRAL
jgi:virulence-associated protein VagC